VKVTCAQRETLPIAGFALEGNKWDGIYISREKAGQLIYAGKVDHGFTPESEKDSRATLKPLIRKTQLYAKKIAHGIYGLSLRYWQRLSIGPSRPKARCAARFYKGIGRTCDGEKRRLRHLSWAA
jgi:bifunctional non-homologous end joining protein LigD